jgi:hypothetical protein
MYDLLIGLLFGTGFVVFMLIPLMVKNMKYEFPASREHEFYGR